MPASSNPQPVTPLGVTQPEERLRLLGQLAASVSHDLRNPLNAFSLHADILEEEFAAPGGGDRQQLLASLATMRNTVIRLYERSQEFLTLTRLSVLSETPEDCGALLEALCLEMQDALAIRNIALHLEQPPDLGQAMLDHTLFRQALRSLLCHITETMPHGGHIMLRGLCMESRIRLEVCCREISLPPEHLAHLFDPLRSAEAAGTGLGLYLVRETVEAHRGHITVRSAPDKGTTFTIILPRFAQETASAPQAIRPRCDP